MAEDNLTPELYSEKNILIGRVQKECGELSGVNGASWMSSVKEMMLGRCDEMICSTRHAGSWQWHGPGQSCPRMHLLPNWQ